MFEQHYPAAYYLGNLYAEQYSCDNETDTNEPFMASSAPGKRELGLPHEDMEELLMHEAMFLESEKAITEAEETKGFGFLLGEVRQWKPFQESFDKLVSKGCSPYILLHGLNHLLRTEQQQTSSQLPRKREIRSLETRLLKGVESILAFEKKYEEAHRTMVFSHFSYRQNAGLHEHDFYLNRRDLSSQAQNPCLTQKMLGYAEMLHAWWTPRSDALRTYASVHNCVYAKVVTGKSSILGSCRTEFQLSGWPSD